MARYLWNELAADVREAFEEHFLSCPACAEDLPAEAVFAANLRPVFRETGMQTGPAFWEIHRCLAMVGGEICGAFSNAATALETARHEAQRLDLERQRMGRSGRAASYYVRDRRTGQRITEGGKARDGKA